MIISYRWVSGDSDLYVMHIAAFEIIHALVMMKFSLILPPLYDSINNHLYQ